jgi:hypothetical protein
LLAAGDEVTAAADGVPPVPQPVNPGIIQDVKHVPGMTAQEPIVVPPSVARQRWTLAPLGTSGSDRQLFLIESLAAPGKFLQPADPAHPGPVVLGSLPLGSPPRTKAWKVTSPLLPG